MKNLIAGNWKMNGNLKSTVDLSREIISHIQQSPQLLENNEFLVCPSFAHLVPVQTQLTQAVALGGQDCSPFEDGAYTGDISATMLKDLNCDYVILGHSERRQYYVESNMMIQQKASVAHAAGLKAVICVGETEQEREDGQHEEVVAKQLAKSIPETASAENTVIAYEPVWAIGTGKVPTIEDIAAMHDFMRAKIKQNISDSDNVRLLYGGSVKPSNAAEILAVENVNGALIGGASLKAEDFIGIAAAA